MSLASLSPTTRGILAMVASSLALTTQDAITKWMTAGWRPEEIIFYRGLWALLPAFMMLGGSSLRGAWPRRPGWTFARAILHATTSFTIAASFVRLPLADALALVYASPIILTALSVPLLGERVGWQRWAAVGIGFVGVLVMTRPSPSGIDLVMLIPLAAATMSALRDVATRKVAGVEPAAVMFFWSQATIALAGAAAVTGAGTRWPTAGDWGLFAAAGMLQGLAHYLIIVSLHLAPASVVSPLRFLALAWAALFGWIVWGQLPDAWIATGMVTVVASSLMILNAERRRR